MFGWRKRIGYLLCVICEHSLLLPPTPTGRQAIVLLSADSVLAWPLMGPPGLPAEQVGESRAAFDAMMSDPKLVGEASRQGLDIDPVRGNEIAALVDRRHQAPLEVIEQVRRINAAR